MRPRLTFAGPGIAVRAIFAAASLSMVACSDTPTETTKSAKARPARSITPTITPQISAGDASVCGLDPAGTVRCWGEYGDAPAGTYVQVSAGAYHACALRVDATVVCWGIDPYGYHSLDVPVGSYLQVSAGNLHSCALRTDQTIVCWGSNDYGQSGAPDGTFTEVSAATFHSCGLKTDGTMACWGGGFFDIGSTRPGTFTQIAAGADHTCALNPDATVLCWGNGRSGIPGTFSVISAGGAHDCGMRTDGTPVCWGDNGWGQLNMPNEPFVQIAAGYRGTCGLKADLTIICWGQLTLNKQLTTPPGTTTTGSNVPVAPIDQTTGQPAPVSMTFGTVTSGGTTTVTSSTVGQSGSPTAPSDFRLGNPPTYYDVVTTATYTGVITLCFDYSSVSYSNVNQLKLLHYTNGTWVDITSPGYPNTQTHLICGTTTSLSPFLVAQTNAAPSVTSVVLPAAPVAVGSGAINVTAGLSDADVLDTHTAVIAWGDGSQSAGSVLESGGAGTIAGAHSYAQSGVYTVTVTASDGVATGSRSSSQETTATYVVVYDPSGGFVVGGGWVTSPAGACQVLSLCGSTIAAKATFGFVSKYQKGATVPTGNTEFQYQAGGFSFKSGNYDWLVISGARAQYKGSGAINGSGDYGFLLTAVDGQLTGGGGTDKFRIKIWDKTSGQIVYDTEFGTSDSSTPTTILGGGSIAIQK